MQGLRNFLIGAILVVTFLLFIEWNEFSETQKQTQNETALATQTQAQSAGQNLNDLENLVDNKTESEITVLEEPIIASSSTVENIHSDTSEDLPSLNTEEVKTTPPTFGPKAQLVKVKTDNLEILIDTFGGDIIQSSLLNHHAKLNEPENHLVLLNRNNQNIYVAQSGLIGKDGTDKGSQSRPTFSVSQESYELNDNEEELIVDLTLEQKNVTITKRFHFKRNTYLIGIEYLINNKSAQDWSAAMYGQIRRDSHVPESDTGIGMSPFTGAAITTPEKNYKKMDFDDIEDESFKVAHTGGWIAMVQHYFVSAWIPDSESTNNYQIRKLSGKDIYLFEYAGPVKTIAANSQGSIKSSFYTGPKDLDKLEEISPYLDLTLDYSFLWFIAKPLFTALDFIHSLVGNWGIAIILLTVLIKVVFFYPSAVSYRSMAKMRKLSPMMAQLKERYGDDRQKMSSELMGLYRKEKVNPLGGCLPILLQMPVFISLYWVIMESVELRHSPFYFWIHDLSIKDPFFILPAIMGVTMFIQQKLNPTPPDPMQAKVMQLMPIFFTFLFMFFPAGLVLYWVVNNTLSIAQQYVITKQIENASS